MAKTIIPARECSEPGMKSRLANFDINTLRKPPKMTATLKRRALKKKTDRKLPDEFRAVQAAQATHYQD